MSQDEQEFEEHNTKMGTYFLRGHSTFMVDIVTKDGMSPAHKCFEHLPAEPITYSTRSLSSLSQTFHPSSRVSTLPCRKPRPL